MMDRGRVSVLLNALEEGLRGSDFLTVHGGSSYCIEDKCFFHVSVESLQCEIGGMLRNRIDRWKKSFGIGEGDVEVRWERNGKGSVDVIIMLDVDFVGITDESGVSCRAMDTANPALIHSPERVYHTEVIAMDPNLDRRWLEKRLDKIDENFDEFVAKVDERLEKADEKAAEKFDKFVAKVDERFEKADEKAAEKFDKFVAKVDERLEKADEKAAENFDKFVAKVDERFEKADEKADEKFDKFVVEVRDKFVEVNERFEKADEKFDKFVDKVDERFEKVDEKFEKADEKADERFEKADEKFDKFVDKIDDKFETVNENQKETLAQIAKIEGNLTGREAEKAKTMSKVMAVITAVSVGVSVYLAFFQ